MEKDGDFAAMEDRRPQYRVLAGKQSVLPAGVLNTYEDTAEEQDCFGGQMELASGMQARRVCCSHAVPQPEENADVAVIRCRSRGKCD